MATRIHVEAGTDHLPEILAMLILSVIVVIVVTVLTGLIDLSAGQSVKISAAYIIMGHMLLDRFIPLGS